jgi:hypothetical protein
MTMYHEKGMDIRNTNFNIISTTAVITPFAERRAHKPNAEMEELSPHFSRRNKSNLFNEYHGDVIFHRVAEKL